MSLPAYDDFNRANGALGSNWSGSVGQDLVISSNGVIGVSGQDTSMYWSADLPSADQYTQATVVDSAAEYYRGPLARASSTDWICFVASPTYWRLEWYNGGAWTVIGSSYGSTPATNDVAKITAEGTTFKGYVNGTERCSGSNASAPSSGYGGLYCYDSQPKLDDFEVGNLGGPTPDSVLASPASATTVSESPWSDNDWVNPTDVYSDDGNAANITSSQYDSPDQSYVLKAYNFDFSSIPSGATIVGVICRINGWCAAGTGTLDLCQLLDTSLAKVGTNLASTPVALTSDDTTIIVRGASNNLWGNSLTEAWVKNSNFGVALGMAATSANADVYIDYVTLEVFYTSSPTDDLVANSIATGNPVLGHPTIGQIHLLDANDIATAGPVLEHPTIIGIVDLISNNIVTAGPVLEHPTIVAAIGLDANDISSGLPVLEHPTIGQVHVLVGNSLSTAEPTLEHPTIITTSILVANDISSGSPTLGHPSITSGVGLTPNDISTGAPTLGHPSLGQIHSLTADSISAGAPILGPPSIGQTHVLDANDISSGVPVVGHPSMTGEHALTADDISTASPTLGHPDIGQTHVLQASDLTTDSPTLDHPTVNSNADLTAVDISSGNPTLEHPSLSSGSSLVANNISSGTPTLDHPSIEQTHVLDANDVSTGAPVVGHPAIGSYGEDVLIANDIASGEPTLDNPTIGQIHALVANGLSADFPALDHPDLAAIPQLIAEDISSGGPSLGQPSIGQVHALQANDISAGEPTLDHPIFRIGLPPNQVDVAIEQEWDIETKLSQEWALNTEITQPWSLSVEVFGDDHPQE